MAEHLMVVVEDKYGNAVAPNSLLVHRGDYITILNLTGGLMDLEFLQENPLKQLVKNVESGEAGKVRIQVQDNDSISYGSYPYKPFCHAKQQYAEASIPRIIIYPGFN